MILAILEFLGGIVSKIATSTLSDWAKGKWFSKNKKDDKAEAVDTEPVIEPVIEPEFVYRYEPGRISIEKIIQIFGAADTKTEDSDNIGEAIILYKYFFGNAKVLLSTYPNKSDIISVTVFSKELDENPVYCRMSEAEEYIPLGQALINDFVIEDARDVEHVSNGMGMTTNITATYGHRNIKHLAFVYQVEGTFENANDAKGEIIRQVCVTQSDYVRPMLSFHDTFYY